MFSVTCVICLPSFLANCNSAASGTFCSFDPISGSLNVSLSGIQFLIWPPRLVCIWSNSYSNSRATMFPVSAVSCNVWTDLIHHRHSALLPTFFTQGFWSCPQDPSVAYLTYVFFGPYSFLLKHSLKILVVECVSNPVLQVVKRICKIATAVIQMSKASFTVLKNKKRLLTVTFLKTSPTLVIGKKNF